MCGIVAIFQHQNSVTSKDVIDCLKKLEYRGYDSAGLALWCPDQPISIIKSIGRIQNLQKACESYQETKSSIAIGHTRWATHGTPSLRNTHPITCGKIAVVHNGMIENYREILEKQHYPIHSDTDTEAIAMLISQYYKDSLCNAVRQAMKYLRGRFAFCAIAEHEETLVAACAGAPLVLGYTETDGYILASDHIAFPLNVTHIMYLDHITIVEITREKVTLWDKNGDLAELHLTPFKPIIEVEKTQDSYLLQEIFEQPSIVHNVISHHKKSDILLSLQKNKGVLYLIGCGSSYYSALVVKYLLEERGITVITALASEFRYQQITLHKQDVCICISQSGETADTLAVAEYAQNLCHVIAFVNVEKSTIARIAHEVFCVYAGRERSVASTKAFTAQVCTLLCILLGQEISADIISQKINETLNLSEKIRLCAEQLLQSNLIIYVARGILWPIVCEGVLKIQELSYIPALSFAAGEIKHGPLALVDKKTSIVFLLNSKDATYKKSLSNLEEILARGASVWLFSDKPYQHQQVTYIHMPECSNFEAPLVYVIAMQILAYHAARSLGHEVDHPRNIAKSVTVE